MGDLLLNDFEVQNFCGFENLQINHLGRVNLIVGRNSVGKSSLLESLWLYANAGAVGIILDILRTHREINARLLTRASDDIQTQEQEDLVNALLHLFYNRPKIEDLPVSIKMGSMQFPQNTFSLTLGWYSAQNHDKSGRRQPMVTKNNINTPDVLLGLDNQYADQPQIISTLENILRNRYLYFASKASDNNFIRVEGVDDALISQLWGKVALTDLEDEIIKGLRIVSSQVDRVAVITNEARTGDPNSIIVKLQNSNIRVPLRTLGDGMSRVFGVILTLVNCKGGVLLIDEIESGLHYTVMVNLWKLILQIARRLNVQVFATTHSWDCVQAFQKATSEDQQEEGILIRLENKNDKVIAVIIDEETLETLTSMDLEVR